MNIKFRKMIACLLMLALMVTLVCNATFTAFAAEATIPDTINLYINGGTKVTNSDEVTAKLASGTATLAYDDVTKSVTLTLINATIETIDRLGIDFCNTNDFNTNLDDNITFNIVLVGDNTITSTSTDSEVNAILVESANLNIAGSGNLNISASTGEDYENYWNRTIHVSNGNISFNSTGTINVSGKSEKNLSHLVAIYTNGNIDVNSGVINAYVNRDENGVELSSTADNCAAIFVGANFRGINIENATVNAYAGKGNSQSCGIGGDPGTVIEISNNATVNAYGGTALGGCNSYGIGTSLYSYGNGTYYPDTYAVRIEDSDVTAVGGESESGNSYGIGSEGSLEVVNSSVTATAGNSGIGSYGIGVGYAGNYGDIKISDDSDVKATSGQSGNLSYGIGASGSLTISDSSKVKAYANNVTNPSTPYYFSFGVCSVGGITLSEANTLDLYGVHRAIGSVGGIGFTTVSGANYKLLNNGTEISVNDIATTTLGQKLELMQFYNVNFTGAKVTSNGTSTVIKGTDYVATLVPNENYKITSDNIVIKSNGVDVTGYTFDESTGVLTIPASLITGDIQVTATAIRISYPVNLISGENYTFGNTTTAQKGSDYTVTLTPSSNYKISASDISVTVGGTAVDGFTYNDLTDVLTIPASLVTDTISISAQAKIITFPVNLKSSTVTFAAQSEANAGSDYTVAMTASANNILPENIIVKIGDSVITNYTYKNGGVTGRGTLTIPASVITDEITIIVESKIMSYLVTFVDFDGKTLKVETIEHGKDAIAPEAPVRVGYKFTGWDKETENITADTIIKALYQQISTVGSGEDVAESEPTETAPKSEGSFAEKTGDTTNLLMLFVILFSGSASLVVLNLNTRKKKTQI